MGELDRNAGAAEVSISTRIDPDGTPVVGLSGELDTSNVASLDQTLASLAAEHRERLIFDLGELRFMDSAGIAVLVQIAAQVNTVEVRDPSPIVRRLIDVTGLAGVLRIEP